MRPSKLRTGIIFIGIGIALLLYNMDRIPGGYFEDLLHLWPILLVAIGLEIIARHSRMPALGYLSPVLIIGAFLYAGYGEPVGWNDGSWISFGDSSRTRTETRMFQTDADFSEARVYVDLYDGDLKIAGGAKYLGEATFSAAGRIPSSLSIDDEDRAIMRIRQSGSSRRAPAEMYLKLSNDVPMVLDLQGRDAEIDLDGRNMHLQRLYLEIDDGMAGITLGKFEDSIWASIDPGRSKIKLRLPEGAGLRLEGALVDSDIDFGSLTVDETADDGIESDGFESSQPRITVHLAKTAKSIKVESY